jgi:mono/diheme cytochrome c family protein
MTIRSLVAASAFIATSLPGADFTLIGELNCTSCHAASSAQAAWILPKPAPGLQEVGSRAEAAWMTKFLASPGGSAMPDVLHGNAEQAEALTHYLLSLSKPDVRRVLPDKAAVARGENLYHSIGCVACHAPQDGTAAPAEFVALPRMAEKWGHDGLRKFLLDPLASRPGGRMPSLHLTDREASDIAQFLLRETRVPAAVEVGHSHVWTRPLEDLDEVVIDRTVPAPGFVLEQLTGTMRFTAWLKVPQTGDYTLHLTAAGASRLSVDGEWVMGTESWKTEKVQEKYLRHLEAGRHELKVDFVKRGPSPHSLSVEWQGPGIVRGPIPAANLSSEREPTVEPAPFVLDAAKAEQGRALYSSMNCAACHEQKAPALPALAALDLSRGCLAEKPSQQVPDYHFNETQRAAVREALAHSKPPTPQERLTHTLTTFRCTACHVRDGMGGVAPDRAAYFTANGDDLGDEGRLPPKLDGVGDKLRPEWLAKVLGDGAPVRPYINTRMPKFGAANVGHLAELLVTLDRRETRLVPATDQPEVQREAGRRLAGTDGLSCIACHKFNRQPAHTMQVLDLISSPQRLNEDWFRRFLRDPNKFNNGTRMPALWPGGHSLIPTLLDGDTDRQHAALWTYLADGATAKFPEGLSRQNMELIVGGEALVYRGKMWEAGFRAIATGYPGGANAAFDAGEMRLALLWRGRFLNVSPHWSVQGMGAIRPLEDNPVILPHGSPFAILRNADTPWPQESSRELGMKFTGYQMDAQQRPTLLYRFGGLAVEDFISPVGNGLLRTLTLSGTPPSGLHLRLATGKLTTAGESAWRLNETLTITAPGSLVRNEELLVPLITTQLEIRYVW